MAQPTGGKKKLPSGRHLSQIKRQRQNEKLRLANQQARSRIRTAIKQVRTAVAQSNKEAARKALKDVTSLYGKAAKTHLVHPRHASRNVSRLSRLVSQLAA